MTAASIAKELWEQINETPGDDMVSVTAAEGVTLLEAVEAMGEALKRIKGIDSRIDATIQSDGKDRRVVMGEFAFIAAAALAKAGL